VTAAEELRAAAARIRGRAEKATSGPWAATDSRCVDGPDGEHVVASVAARMLWPTAADAEHIAAWSPDPALAVATWLELTADRHAPHQLPTAPDGYAICWICDKGPHNHVPAPCPDLAAAMAVVLAIPGGES